MPDLPAEVVEELENIANRYVKEHIPGASLQTPRIGVGGSAAVFKVSTRYGDEALKILNPTLFSDHAGTASNYRVSLQQKLVNHDCSSLIDVKAVEIFENTCVCRMAYLSWKELKDSIQDIPDNNIQSIVDQLVVAVQFLARNGLVHRDIKPENILISSNFKEIKLVDFGVVRDISPQEDRLDGTDIGDQRPFLATAQYSPPEYLFRTIEPSEDLWNALNIYQIGAVIHDLISKKAIFTEEMNTGNRYRVALAVLQKRPTIPEERIQANPRLAQIAQHCLIKDPALRTSIVSIHDFAQPDNQSPPDRLTAVIQRQKLAHLATKNLDEVLSDTKAFLESSLTILSEKVVQKLISTFGKDIKCHSPQQGARNSSLKRTISVSTPKIHTIPITFNTEIDPKKEIYEYPISIAIERDGFEPIIIGVMMEGEEIAESLIEKSFEIACELIANEAERLEV